MATGSEVVILVSRGRGGGDWGPFPGYTCVFGEVGETDFSDHDITVEVKVKPGALDDLTRKLACFGPVTIKKRNYTEVGRVIQRTVEDCVGGSQLICEYEQIDERCPRGTAGAPLP